MSMTHAYNSQNIFAKIIAGDIPSATIYEDQDVLAFMDAFPQSRGHCLVIPKTGAATNLLTTDTEVLRTLITTTQTIAKAVCDALLPDGFRVVQYNGEAAGQTVFHLHFHIIPVWQDTLLGSHHSGQTVMADLEKLAAQIKSHL